MVSAVACSRADLDFLRHKLGRAVRGSIATGFHLVGYHDSMMTDEEAKKIIKDLLLGISEAYEFCISLAPNALPYNGALAEKLGKLLKKYS
jgi:hypothetical protein